MRRAVLLPALLAILAAGGRADEVVLASGGSLSCEVLEVTEQHVKVRLPHGTMTIPRERVVSIEREGRSRYLRREAGASLRRGATRSAVELYERAYAATPDDATRRGLVDALVAHVDDLIGEFRLDEAEPPLARLRELAPPHLRARTDAFLRRIAQERRRAEELHRTARDRLERGDFHGALAALDLWRLRLPAGDERARSALARAHLGAARAAAEQGHLRAALDHYRAADAFGARNDAAEPLYLLRPVAVLEALREGDFGAAERMLDGIATTYPDPAVPVFLRAVRSHLTGDVKEAVAGYAEAIRLADRARPAAKGCSYDLVRRYATATLRAAIARPPQEGVAKWRELFLDGLEREESRYFVVYAASSATATAIGTRADELYASIAGDLLGGVPAKGRAEIVIHPARQAYLAADPDPPGSPVSGATLSRAQTQGVCYDTLDDAGKPLVRVETYVGQPGLLDDTLPHELVHVVQRRGLAAFRRGKWLDEGLAMLYESDLGRANRLALWRTLARNPIPLPELLALESVPPDRGALFYQQSHAFTDFLRSSGDADDWRTFLDVFARADLAAAVRRAYDFSSVADLERAWLKTFHARPNDE